ncbi:hypothetical protein KR222_006408, partial [Zaprionus bogoriensis]
AADAQGTYDGRNGPHIFGEPGKQVYIRGQNDGAYSVPGVGGTFQNAAGEHVYQDEQGNTFVHRRKGAGSADAPRHSISGPGLAATRGGQAAPAQEAAGGAGYGARTARNVLVVRPDRGVIHNGGGDFVVSRQSRSPDHLVVRPDRHVYHGSDGSFAVSRQSRSAPADFKLVVGPDNVVRYGRRRRSPEPDFHVSRPDRTVVLGSDGSFLAQRQRRSPQRVQGENFVARGNQAGVWNDEVSVWKRPDGRTVTLDKNGNAITSGSPNGRGPQYV